MQTQSHCYAPHTPEAREAQTETAGVIFNKINAGIIKDSHSDFLIRTKPRSNLSTVGTSGGRRPPLSDLLLTFIALLIIKILLTIASVKATKINEKRCILRILFVIKKEILI